MMLTCMGSRWYSLIDEDNFKIQIQGNKGSALTSAKDWILSYNIIRTLLLQRTLASPRRPMAKVYNLARMETVLEIRRSCPSHPSSRAPSHVGAREQAIKCSWRGGRAGAQPAYKLFSCN